jgi:betaine lipid synthase
MASLTPSILSRDPHTQILAVGATVVVLVAVIFASTLRSAKYDADENPSPLTSFLRFFYASFLKPHSSGEGVNGQQDALESFYKAQAGVYDSTRKRLLRGREDMLGLVAAQLVQKAAKDRTHDPKRIWVDVRCLCLFACLLVCSLKRTKTTPENKIKYPSKKKKKQTKNSQPIQ